MKTEKDTLERVRKMLWGCGLHAVKCARVENHRSVSKYMFTLSNAQQDMEAAH